MFNSVSLIYNDEKTNSIYKIFVELKNGVVVSKYDGYISPKYKNKERIISLTNEQKSLFLDLIESCKFECWQETYTTNDNVNRHNTFSWNVEYKDDYQTRSFKGINTYPFYFRRLVKTIMFACPLSKSFLNESFKVTYESSLDHSPFTEPRKEELIKKNIIIIPIGSGSTGNSIYVEIEGKKILIDMGISSRKIEKALNERNRKLEEIDAILVTHGHSDHICAAKTIIKKTKCNVYANYWTIEEMKKYDVDSSRLFDVDYCDFLENIELVPLRLSHDFFMTYGYVLKTEKAKYSHITDTGVVDEEVLKEILNSDVVIIESNHDRYMLDNNPNYPLKLKQRIISEHGHLSNIECGETILKLYESGTRNFLLAHLSRHNNTPALALETVKLMMREKWINIYICPIEGSDLLEY